MRLWNRTSETPCWFWIASEKPQQGPPFLLAIQLRFLPKGLWRISNLTGHDYFLRFIHFCNFIDYRQVKNTNILHFQKEIFEVGNWKLSRSIYDLVLINICHFHHHWLIVTQNWSVWRYSCLYLESRIHEFWCLI